MSASSSNPRSAYQQYAPALHALTTGRGIVVESTVLPAQRPPTLVSWYSTNQFGTPSASSDMKSAQLVPPVACGSPNVVLTPKTVADSAVAALTVSFTAMRVPRLDPVLPSIL